MKTQKIYNAKRTNWLNAAHGNSFCCTNLREMLGEKQLKSFCISALEDTDKLRESSI